MQIWPFVPLSEIVETLEWKTDVFMAKSQEQRHALRQAPRRQFSVSHHFDDAKYAAARLMVKGNTEFYFPDWAQRATCSAITAGSSVAVTADLAGIDLTTGDRAILWESVDQYEEVTIEAISPLSLTTVVNSYAAPYLMPLLGCHAPEGLSNPRLPCEIHQASITFEVYENDDLSATSLTQYRGHDVLEVAPVIGSGSFQESSGLTLSPFDNETSIPHYIQARDTPENGFMMRWHEFGSSLYTLRQWLHSRRGRQKVFWLSSWLKDLSAASDISDVSTTLNVFTPVGLSTITTPFDIEIVGGGTKYYRQVTAAAAGTDVNSRATLDLTIDSALGVALTASQISRISFLRCARFDADRIEINHRAGEGATLAVPCVEVPVP